MLRKLLIAVYLLAILALAGLWVRSATVIDSVCVSWTDGRFIRLTSSNGKFIFQLETQAAPVDTFEYWRGSVSDHPWPSGEWYGTTHVPLRFHPRDRNQLYTGISLRPDAQWESPRLGVEYERGRSWVLLIAPLAMPLALLVLAGPPVWWLARVVRRVRRRRRNLCVGCGYDLRGSLDAGAAACPECGRAVEPLRQ
jgi:hypothetical protein